MMNWVRPLPACSASRWLALRLAAGLAVAGLCFTSSFSSTSWALISSVLRIKTTNGLRRCCLGAGAVLMSLSANRSGDSENGVASPILQRDVSDENDEKRLLC